MLFLRRTQDENWTYIRWSKDVQDVFGTSYICSIYVLCLQGINWVYNSNLKLLLGIDELFQWEMLMPYVKCNAFSLPFFLVSDLGVLRFFHFFFNVLTNQSEETSTYYPSVTTEIVILIFEFIIHQRNVCHPPQRWKNLAGLKYHQCPSYGQENFNCTLGKWIWRV